MKIGILTLPLHTNYGGILQAYALQNILKDFGHDAYLLEEEAKKLYLPIYKAPFVYAKRILKKYILKKSDTIVFLEKKLNLEYDLVMKYTRRFVIENIKRKEVNHFNQILHQGFDAFVVGSDQIWRPLYYKKIENAFLDFAGNWHGKRISYAPSFGTDNLEYNVKQLNLCKKLLKRFDAVSVRESSGIQFCEKHFDLSPTHVLDPTFLLNVEHYQNIIYKSNTPQSSGEMLIYILDQNEDKKHIISRIEGITGHKGFRVNSNVEDYFASVDDRIQPSVESWLRGFNDAKFIITDSFHACVFAIIFNKPFVAIGNKMRGLTRFSSLLKIFNLEHCLISTFEKDFEIHNIDWKKVNSILEIEKKKSKKFLKESLENN